MYQSKQNRSIVPNSTTIIDDQHRISSSSPPPPCLKLIADCWEHIFEYLSFMSMLAMGQTCKRMSEMVGNYIRENYPKHQFQLNGHKIQFLRGDISAPLDLETDFYKHISELYVSYRSEMDFFLAGYNLDSLKTLILKKCHLTELKIGYMQNVLTNLETIKLVKCHIITRNIFELFAQYCLKLKNLDIHYCDMINNDVNTVFSQHYPKLKRLQFRLPKEKQALKIDEVQIFLEKHSNLKQFEVNAGFLWVHRDLLSQTNIQLNLLNIYFDKYDTSLPTNSLVEFLNALNERGFCKMIQLTPSFERRIRDQTFNVISTLPSVKQLSIHSDKCIDVNQLTGLKYLHMNFILTFANMETLAKNLPNLERLSVNTSYVDGIVPFVRHSMRLKTIRVGQLAEFYKLDLLTLNQERKTLENACHISIYVFEHVYLVEKWKRQNLNCSHVRIMRLDLSLFSIVNSSDRII